MEVLGFIVLLAIAIGLLSAYDLGWLWPLVLTVIAVAVTIAAGVNWHSSVQRRRLLPEVEKAAEDLLATVSSAFEIEDCPRCHESEARLVSVSPNARSIEYQCVNCGETIYGKARSADAQKAKDLYDELMRKGRQYREHLGKSDQEMRMSFNSKGGVAFRPTEKSR